MAEKSSPKIALAMLVKDEPELLRANLVYHHYVGVDTAYVFIDGDDPATRDSIRDLPYVQLPSETATPTLGAHSNVARARAEADRDHNNRQLLAMAASMERARADDCDWLIFLDPDELVCVDRRRAAPGGLLELFAAVPAGADAVYLPPFEVLQGASEAGAPFWSATWFKGPGWKLKKRLWDPVAQNHVTLDGFYGHTVGKMAVRLTANAVPASVHGFTAWDGGALQTAERAMLLHYYAFDSVDFRRKFARIDPDRVSYPDGRSVAPQKTLWTRMIAGGALDDAALEGYYREWVGFSAKQRRSARWRDWISPPWAKKRLVRVTSVRDTFEGPLAEVTKLADAPA